MLIRSLGFHFLMFSCAVIICKKKTSYRNISFEITVINSQCFFPAGDREHSLKNQTNNDYENDFSNYTIDQLGCRIPKLDLFSPVVMKIYGKEPDLFCGTRTPLFTEDGRFLHFNTSALPHYGSQQVACSFSSFERKEGVEDKVRYLSTKPLFTDQPNEILDEFISVTCVNSSTGKKVYKDYFAFLPLKKVTEDRCSNVDKSEVSNKNEFLSTLIVGLDTLSRLQFHRHFPKSMSFLKECMDAVEMMGYNKVEENTYPNLVPLLSGLTIEELNVACLNDHKGLVDTCPIIWKKYHEKGYRTIFAEDGPDLAIFNYGAIGFQYQPTDYYLRPMYLQYERGVGHNNIGCGNRCLGSQSSLSFLLNHARKTAQVFNNMKYFAFHWSCSSTHDTFNIPTQIDKTLEVFLQTLVKDNLLNHTLLIVMSDHGPRVQRKSNFFYTSQGQCEKRLPLLMIVFPEWFKKKYAQALVNVQKNSRMLTSHFDLHHTLLDLMDLDNLKNDGRLNGSEEDSRLGRSLFLPISTNRTCQQAGIPAKFCACDCLNLPVPRNKTCFWLSVWEVINFILIAIMAISILVIARRQRASG